MKMEYKLEMKNETDINITRHSLPTRMCFDFFYPPHKNFEILPTHIAHIGKSHQPTRKPKFAKECKLADTHLRMRLNNYEL